jgi:hypothetical protein
MCIEHRFDIPLIASLALREKQIQQNYRPIIAVHKWFARRPGTLFRGLMLSEFIDQRLDETYFNGHDFAGKVVADPFMGGGTPLIFSRPGRESKHCARPAPTVSNTAAPGVEPQSIS